MQEVAEKVNRVMHAGYVKVRLVLVVVLVVTKKQKFQVCTFEMTIRRKSTMLIDFGSDSCLDRISSGNPVPISGLMKLVQFFLLGFGTLRHKGSLFDSCFWYVSR